MLFSKNDLTERISIIASQIKNKLSFATNLAQSYELVKGGVTHSLTHP